MKKREFILFLVLSILVYTLDNSVEDIDVILAIDPLIVGSIITGGAGLLVNAISSIFGSSTSSKNADLAYDSAMKTNSVNMQMVRETNQMNAANVDRTNAMNRELAEKQNQWNIEQWNRENAYNSPANQVELYKAAGLNPALASGQFTPAQQLLSTDLANQQAAQAVAPQIEDPAKASLPYKQQALEFLTQIGKSLGTFANGVSDASIKESQIKRNQILNDVSRYDIKIAQKQESLMAATIKKVQNENELFSKTFEARLIQAWQAVDLNDQLFTLNNEEIAIKHGLSRLTAAQAEHEEVKTAMSIIGLKYCERMNQAELYRLAADTYRMNMEGMQKNLENDFMRNNGGYTSSDLVGKYVADKSFEGTKYSADKSAETIRSEGRANRWTNIQMQNQRLGFEDKWRTHSEVREYTKLFVNGLAVGAGTYFGVTAGAPGKFASGLLRTVNAFKLRKLPLPDSKLISNPLAKGLGIYK